VQELFPSNHVPLSQLRALLVAFLVPEALKGSSPTAKKREERSEQKVNVPEWLSTAAKGLKPPATTPNEQ